MIRTVLPITALGFCYAFLFYYLATSYGQLPEKVASHFDIEGHPNGWMSRRSCVGFTLGLALIVPAIIVGTMAGARRIPVSFVNLPHRDYWLDPLRRDASTAVLLRFALWFSCVNVLFFAGLHWLIVQANLPGDAPHLTGRHIAWVSGAFLVATMLWVLLLLRRFSRISHPAP